MEKVSQALPCFHLMEVQRKLREKLGFSIQFSPEKSFAMVYHPRWIERARPASWRDRQLCACRDRSDGNYCEYDGLMTQQIHQRTLYVRHQTNSDGVGL